MKKVAFIFLKLMTILAIVLLVLCTIGVVCLAIFSPEIISSFEELENGSEEAGVAFVAVMITTLIIGMVVCLGPIIVCPLTRKYLKVAKSRNQMLPFAILNVIFGSTVAAIMLFVMGNRYYQEETVISE